MPEVQRRVQRPVVVLASHAEFARALARGTRRAGRSVELVEATEGRELIRLGEQCLDAVPRPDLLVVHANPRTWAVTALIGMLRLRFTTTLPEVVLITEGPMETLPVQVADYPRLRMLTPTIDADVAVAELAGLTAVAAGQGDR